MIIREEQPEDLKAVFAVHAASFPTDGEARLVDALRDGGNLTVSLVAEVDGAVVGHVAFSPVTCEGEPGGIGLAPVAVLEARRRLGIADALIRAGLDRCRDLGLAYSVVLGDPAYYARFGYRSASTWSLRDEYGGGEAFQAMALCDGGLPEKGGLVKYAPEFGLVG